jgi:hypothetical protein
VLIITQRLQRKHLEPLVMATKKGSPCHKTILPDSPEEKLRKQVWHLLVDLNLTAANSTTTILATILSTRLDKTVSRNTLCMALSGYRLTPPYVEYLRELKDHLQTCKRNQINPVSLYTEEPNNQAQNERRSTHE